MADFQWIDMGLEQILKHVHFLDETNARVGIVGDAGDRPSGNGRMTVGEVALINEFGTESVRSRSFMRSALRTAKAHELAYFLAETALTFGNVEQALHAAGEGLAEIMRAKITHGELRQNKASTIERKGFNSPVLETGVLLTSIDYELVRASGGILSSGGTEGEEA